MGTKVQYKSCVGGYNPMRDLDDDLNTNSWPILCEEKNIPKTGFIPRITADVYTGYDKNALKHKMLEHDAIFKNQVHELHRLYKIQKVMMEDIKTKEHSRHRGSIEPSSSSSIKGSQVPYDDVRKWHLRSYPLMDSCHPRSTVPGAEDVNSPLSCAKVNSSPASRIASKNGFPKEFEVSEARPSKVRKKLFDLQLPADEYVDIEDDEQLDNNVSGLPRFTPCKEFKTPESSMKLTVNGVKMGGLQGEYSSVSHHRSSSGVADLNEPINIEEETESSSANIFGHSTCNGGSKAVYFSAKPKQGFLNLQKEVVQKSIHGNQLGSLNGMPAENKINGREWFPYSHGAGHGGGNHSSDCRGVQLDNQSLPLTPSQAMLNQANPSGSHFTDHSNENLRNSRLGRGLAAPHRNHDYSNHSHLEPVMTSQVSNPLPFMNCSNDAGAWPQLMQSLGTPDGFLKPKLTSSRTYPSLGPSPSLNKVLQSSAFSNHISRDKWHVNSSFSSNPCLASDLPSNNGFYQGSSSRSKELPVCFSSIGFNHLNSNRSDNSASVHMVNGREKAFTSGFVEIKPSTDINLNVTFPKNALEEPVLRQDLDRADGNCKPEAHQPLFPWLRTKPAFNIEATNSRRQLISTDESPPRASPSLLYGKSKAEIDLNQIYNDTCASNNHGRAYNETNGIPILQKILGVPIFEKLSVSENRALPLLSSTPEAEHAKHDRKNRLIDINVACDASLIESDEEPVKENEMGSRNQLDKSSCARNFIDLNTCFDEDEDPPVANVESITAPKKVVVDIDLEALAVPEEEDNFLPERDEAQEQDITLDAPDDTEQAEVEGMRSAAEVIVDISSCQHIHQENVICSPSDAAEEELLQWFAGVVSTTPTFVKEGSYKVMDDFEAMILQLPETKEEDFMPKPYVHEVQTVDETRTNTLPIRPRRGQGRRGRQRRDFQRDILPGLVSLSRLEMTEDLQTFGGLMKAMGHSWNPGSTRRNGGRNGNGRGRRRTVAEAAPPVAVCTKVMQQIDSVETSLEKRSLTSWGKTTRRPRRQRCPAGNTSTISLT